MKTLLILSLLLIDSPLYAQTYEKTADRAFSVTQQVTTAYDVDAIKARIQQLQDDITAHNGYIAKAQAEIDSLNVMLSEAGKAGVDTSEKRVVEEVLEKP